MLGISIESIRIDAYDKDVEIKSEDPDRKYHKKIEVSEDIDIESGRSNYNNGVLEITFKRKNGKNQKVDKLTLNKDKYRTNFLKCIYYMNTMFQYVYSNRTTKTNI